jgi:hypothetical protein
MASKANFGGGEVPSALMKEFKAAELEELRFLIKDEFSPMHFFSLYKDWLVALDDLPINLHPVEYQLFYMNLRANALRRVAAMTGATLP